MAGADYNILNSFKSIDDYRKANEEFQAKRLLMAAQNAPLTSIIGRNRLLRILSRIKVMILTLLFL